MKIAVLMHGLAGYTNKYGTGKSTPLSISHDHFVENIQNANADCDIDVYMHSWSTECEDELVSLYKPKQYLFEDQIHFDFEYIVGNPSFPMNEGKTENGVFKGVENIRFHSLFSRWYSAKSAYQLMESSGADYDLVLLTRFDLAYTEKMVFNQIDTNKLTIIPPISHHGIHDLFFIGSVSVMKKMSQMFDFVSSIKTFEHWGVHSHYLSAVHVQNCIGFGNVAFFGTERLWDSGLEGLKTGPAPLVRDYYDLFKINEADPLELETVQKIKDHTMNNCRQYSRIK